MPRIHYCPHCELRFKNDSEVRDHLVLDHGVDRTRLEERRARGQGLDPREEEPLYAASEEGEEPQPRKRGEGRTSPPDDFGPFRTP
ncbi:MAG: hypothetical protein M3N52_04760 [Actinomycetota bacterium]|nr:hypothetical protein [Actinomycetota bacterium]